MIRKRIEAFLKKNNEKAASLAEKEVRRSYLPMCIMGLISPPCGQDSCCFLVTRKVSHTALAIAPASWAITSWLLKLLDLESLRNRFSIVFFFFILSFYNIRHFDAKGRKQQVEHCKFWIVALTLLHIRDFQPLLLPEECFTFTGIVLGSCLSDFDGNGM